MVCIRESEGGYDARPRWVVLVLLALATSPRIGSGTDLNVLIELLLPRCSHDAERPPTPGARGTIHIRFRFRWHCHLERYQGSSLPIDRESDQDSPHFVLDVVQAR